jgi:hypothetical protein
VANGDKYDLFIEIAAEKEFEREMGGSVGLRLLKELFETNILPNLTTHYVDYRDSKLLLKDKSITNKHIGMTDFLDFENGWYLTKAEFLSQCTKFRDILSGQKHKKENMIFKKLQSIKQQLIRNTIIDVIVDEFDKFVEESTIYVNDTETYYSHGLDIMEEEELTTNEDVYSSISLPIDYINFMKQIYIFIYSFIMDAYAIASIFSIDRERAIIYYCGAAHKRIFDLVMRSLKQKKLEIIRYTNIVSAHGHNYIQLNMRETLFLTEIVTDEASAVEPKSQKGELRPRSQKKSSSLAAAASSRMVDTQDDSSGDDSGGSYYYNWTHHCY